MLVFMCLYFICTELPQSFSQFKKHIDLQKVTELTFRNEKFTVLKPTLHIITDHFKDFILQRRNEDIGRVFMDRNGFRHVWQGMEMPASRSLRKAEIQEKIVREDKYNIANKINQTDLTSVKSSTKIIKDKPRRKKKLRQDVTETDKISLRNDPVLVTTTFFCPFFGVIRMTSDIENFEDTKTN